MSNHGEDPYGFGAFQVDPIERVLLRKGKPVPITLKAFDTLLLLLRNAGHIVEKDALLKAVWPDTVVEENNLNQSISTLRKAFGESARDHSYIETVPRRGYRFVAQVRRWERNGIRSQRPEVTSLRPSVPAFSQPTQTFQETPPPPPSGP
jgi:DNA-binding winged helix-turn-helix (wHTH) protein